MNDLLPTWGQALPAIVLGILGYLKTRNTDKRIEAKGEDVKKNTPTPDQVEAVELELRSLRKEFEAEINQLKSQNQKSADQIINLAMKYTETTNVLSKEFSAQRFALRKITDPEPPTGSVTVVEDPPQPHGKVIVKP